jgi:phosphatidylinositol alpha-1,6-mannosyltransferase
MPRRRSGEEPDLLILSPHLSPPPGGVQRFAGDVADAFDDRRVLRRGPTVVQAMTWRAALPLMLVRRRPPTVLFCMGGELIRSNGGPVAAWLRRRVLAQVTGVVAISSYTASLVREVGGREPTLVHPPLRDISIGGGPIAHEGVAILSVGRLVPNKGHDRLVRAVADVRAKGIDARLTVAGGGPELANVQALADDLRIADAVRFAGAVDDAELDVLYRSADIFAMLSTPVAGEVEGFGIVFLEANAYGLPAVGGRSGGSVDAVADGVSGLIVDDHAGAVSALAELATDPDRRRLLGEQGKARLSEFTLAKMHDQLDAFYAACAAAHAAGARL